MGIRGELFTTQVPAENRTYFFNVKENTKGDVFLQIFESKESEGTGFDRHAIVIMEDAMQTFLQGLDDSIDFIEKRLKEKLKAKAKKAAELRKELTESSFPGKPSGKPRIKRIIKNKKND